MHDARASGGDHDGVGRGLTTEPHSAAYFGDQRDFWWNDDFVALVAKRLNLASRRDVLDAGSGVGHWGRVLLPHLPNAELVGVDREPRWVADATARAERLGIGSRVRYVRGDVNTLPFDDASFDLVTCQTVLIHVPDVAATVREFLRVLRPGGMLLVTEPNNLANAMCTGEPRRSAPLEERLALVRFQAICEQGKIRLGEGDNSVGDLVPGIFAACGLRDVRAWISDRAALMLPPYASAAERAVAEDLLEMDANGFGLWSLEDTRRYFVAGGGAEAEFEAHWLRAVAAVRADAEAIRAGTYSGGGGGVMYVVAGVKPA